MSCPGAVGRSIRNREGQKSGGRIERMIGNVLNALKRLPASMDRLLTSRACRRMDTKFIISQYHIILVWIPVVIQCLSAHNSSNLSLRRHGFLFQRKPMFTRASSSWSQEQRMEQAVDAFVSWISVAAVVGVTGNSVPSDFWKSSVSHSKYCPDWDLR